MIPPAETERLQDFIRELLNRHSYLHEKRIQKLLFLADLHSIQMRGKRLFDADFKPYYYGVYSDDVSLALQSLGDAKVAAGTTAEGADILVFYKPDRPFKTNLSAEEKRIIGETLSAYSGMTNEQLAQIGKHTVLWESREHGQPFDYESYLKNPLSRTPPAMVKAFVMAKAQEKAGKLHRAESVDEALSTILR